MPKGLPGEATITSARFRSATATRTTVRTEYETRMLREFAGKPGQESYGVVETGREKMFRFMLSMMAEKSCLECHGEYDKAPAFVRARFPAGHYSYNYRLGEVIGAVSVSIPMVDLYHDIGVNLEFDLFNRGDHHSS